MTAPVFVVDDFDLCIDAMVGACRVLSAEDPSELQVDDLIDDRHARVADALCVPPAHGLLRLQLCAAKQLRVGRHDDGARRHQHCRDGRR